MRRYAMAWGILIGWAIGFAIGIPLQATAELGTTFSLCGLVIGYVLWEKRGGAAAPPEAAARPSTSERLKDLEQLRSESRITEEEYQAKRKQILDEV